MVDEQAALPAIRFKLARAHRHLDDLGREMDAWNDRKPYQTVPDPGSNPTEKISRLKLTEPIPIGWAVVLGEIIHNLRSALDQTVYQLTADHDPGYKLKTSFPIFDSPENFKKRGGPEAIGGVGPGPRAFIERLQPYNYPHPGDNALAVVHELWNQDKHRLTHVWGVRLDDPALQVSEPATGCTLVPNVGVVLQDGAEVFRVVCDSPQTKVQVKGHFTAHVAFDNPLTSTGEAEASATVFSLYDAVAGIVGLLLASLGHQDDPLVPEGPT